MDGCAIRGRDIPDIQGLWNDYKQGGSASAREALVAHYIGLARYVVDRLHIRESQVLTRDDLIGHAIMGLIDSIERYDPARGVRFESYAVARIRGTVVDMLRSLDWTPRSVRRTEKSVRDAYARLEGALGRPASDEEIAAELGLSIDAFQAALADIGQASVCSLEDSLQTHPGSDSPFTVEDVLVGAPDPAELAEADERRRLLIDAIGRLSERERLVIALYYDEELTLKEIGKLIGVSEARVSQILSKAMLRLNGRLQRFAPVFCG